MPTRLWNISMILLIGPFAYFTWKSPGAGDAGGQPDTGAT